MYRPIAASSERARIKGSLIHVTRLSISGDIPPGAVIPVPIASPIVAFPMMVPMAAPTSILIAVIEELVHSAIASATWSYLTLIPGRCSITEYERTSFPETNSAPPGVYPTLGASTDGFAGTHFLPFFSVLRATFISLVPEATQIQRMLSVPSNKFKLAISVYNRMGQVNVVVIPCKVVRSPPRLWPPPRMTAQVAPQPYL